MYCASTIAVVLALLAGTPAGAHERPVTGPFYYYVTTQYNIAGGVYQIIAGAGTATALGDFTVSGNQFLQGNSGSFVLGHATLTTARGEVWISYSGYLDTASGYVYGYFSIDGGTGSFAQHYGFGVMAGDRQESWIYLDGLINEPA
jgi:hypothetical protein